MGHTGVLIATLVAAASVRMSEAAVYNISLTTPRGALSYRAMGMLLVEWNASSSAVQGFEVTVRPMDQLEPFDAMPPAGKNPWFWDSANVTASSYALSGGRLQLTYPRTASSPGQTPGRGNAPYYYRKIPMGASMEVEVDCSGPFAAPTASCGLVAFHAGWNTHLAQCVLRQTPANGLQFFMEGIQTAGSAGPWAAASNTAAIRASWSENTKTLTCTFAASAAALASGAGTVSGSLSFVQSSPEALGGDLWWGPMASGAAGNGVGASLVAAFPSARVWMPVPATKPPLINGSTDVCFNKATVQADVRTVGPTVRSLTFERLSANFPYVVDVVEITSDGTRNPATEFVPHAFARPTPPRAWNIGGFWSANFFTPGPRLDTWPDGSGNGHNLRGSYSGTTASDRRPQAVWSQAPAMRVINFDRQTARWMAAGSDAINLGGATAFSMYAETLLTTSAPGIVAGRGMNQRTRDFGYALLQYADVWNPWPGERGMRVTDQSGAQSSQGMAGLAYHWYLKMMTYSAHFRDTNLPAGAANNNLYPFQRKAIDFFRSRDGAATDMMTSNLFLGYSDGDATNFSSFTNPVTVDWSTGSPVPALAPENLNFKIGGPFNYAGDVFRSLGGQVHGVVTYRENHDTATRLDITSWMDWAHFRQCYSIQSPNVVASSSACSAGSRDDYCSQNCANGWTRTAGTIDHWCQGGRYSGAPVICKRACLTFNRPNFILTCSRIYLQDSFTQYAESWNRYVVYPATADIIRDTMWSLSNGIMRASTSNPCLDTAPAHLALHPNRWDLIIPVGGLQAVSARMMVNSSTAIGGLTAHFQSEGSNYMVTVSKTQGMRFYRNSNVEIARVATAADRINVGEWFTMGISVTNGYSFTLTLGNTTIWSGGDPTQSGPMWGSAGMWADGDVSFSNFTISGSCDGGGTCSALSSGQSCTYTCDRGYKTVTTSGGVITCDDNGARSGDMICLTQPPVFQPAVLSVKEHCMEATPVGPIVAIPTNPRQQIDYAITAVYPPIMNQTFEIGSCSGMILVKDPTLVLYNLVKNVTLVIRARPDGDMNAAAYANYTIMIIDIDVAPSFVPAQQTLSVPENYRGPFGLLTTYDEDDADQGKLVYSILFGNDAVPPLFSINASSGAMIAAQPLDFENQNAWPLVVSVAELRDRTMAASTTILVNVIDVNDAPQLASQQIVLDESIASSPAAVDRVLTTMVAFDPDNSTANPGWSSVSYAIVSNARNGTTDLFDLSVTGMQARVRLLTRLNWYDDYFFFYQSQRVRGVYTANISACDAGTPPLCSYASVTLVIQANYSFPLKPTLFSVSRSDLFQTTGGEAVDFIGADFGEIIRTGPGINAPFSINASYCAPAVANATSPQRCYRATGCTVIITRDAGNKITQEVIRCFTVAGWGANLAWSMSVDTQQSGSPLIVRRQVPVQSGGVLQLSYAPPEIDLVALQAGSPALTTQGGAIFRITGRNFGPNDTDLSVGLGPIGAGGMPVFAMQKLVAAHTYILARIGAGCGANLPVSVTIGGAQTSRSTNQAATRISYPSPAITAISLPAPPPGSSLDYSLSTLPTAGGADLILEGTNLGPLTTASAMATDPMGTTSPVTPAVLYQNNEANPLRYVLPAARCYKEAATAHSRVFCRTDPGVGTNFQWQVSVCGLASTFSVARTAFAPPVVTRVTGTGVSGASTQGGQQLSVIGSNLGYVPNNPDDTPRIVRAVMYGLNDQYVAVGCQVVSPQELLCLTNEGTGKNHSLRVNIGGQVSPIFAAGISYAEPVISAFALGQTSPTTGGEEIHISGANFGRWVDRVSVFYTDRPLVRRSRDGLLPGSPPGIVTMYPRSCSFIIPHTKLSCIYNQGAGRKLVWDMTVDGQLSASPSTRYLAPTISGITLLDGAMKATTRGGTRVMLNGTNFGRPDLIQYVRFGVTGTEYLIANFSYISHSALIVTLPPGIGQRLRFTITVSDQSSDQSAATFDYATPIITSVTPAGALTNYNDKLRRIVEVRGREFGLMDPSASVGIAFGNGDDFTLTPLLAPQFTFPASNDVVAGTFTPPAGNSMWEEVVQFLLPESLGVNRSVRVVPYRQGATPSRTYILSLPVMGRSDVFSFVSPVLESVFVSNVLSAEDRAAFTTVFPAFTVDAIPTTARKIEIAGQSLGPTQRTDQVQRVLESLDPVSNTWTTADVGYIAANYSHQSILGFSRVSGATMRLRLAGRGPAGEPAVQLSNEIIFSDVSPRVSGIVGGQDGYLTQGGEWLEINAAGLEATRALNVTIGGRQATLYELGSTTVPIPFDQAGPRIVRNSAAWVSTCPGGACPPFPPGFTWKLRVQVPEGEDVAQGVMLVRDASTSNTDIAIAYYPPRIASLAVQLNLGDASMATQDFVAGAPLLIPTHGARINITGTNIGLCPRALFVLNQPMTVEACPERIIDGRAVKVRNPNVTRSHWNMELTAPEGEGTGVSLDLPDGWRMELTVGTQAAQAPVLLRYLPPSVASVSPTTGPTRGGIQLRVRGANFGVTARNPPRVAIGTDASGWLECLNPVRLSHFEITCTLPEGAGANLQVRVTVAGQAGAGASFSYIRPSVSAVSVSQLQLQGGADAAAAASSPMGSGTISYRWATQTRAYSGTGSTAAPLTVDPSGGAVVTVSGAQFGPKAMFSAAGGSCVFALWDAVLLSNSADKRVEALNSLACDGAIDTENSPGEGEVRAADIISWSHEQVVFRLPAGHGGRKIALMVGGQMPDPDLRSVARRLQQAAPGGGGARTAMAPTPSPMPAALQPDILYSTPAVLSLTPSVRALSTKGGQRVTLKGRFFPPALQLGTGNRFIPTSDLQGGVNATFPMAVSLPITHTVVRVNGRCVASAYDARGRLVPGLRVQPPTGAATDAERAQISAENGRAGCASVLNTGAIMVSPRDPNEAAWVAYNTSMYGPTGWPAANTLYSSSPLSLDALAFNSTPGIGVNRSVSIAVYSIDLAAGEARLFAESNALNLSYAPPRIVAFGGNNGRRIDIDAESTEVDVIILGEDLGDIYDMRNWSPDELDIRVTVDGKTCTLVPACALEPANPNCKDYTRDRQLLATTARYVGGDGNDYVKCSLKVPETTVGFKTTVLRIAGQEGVLDSNRTDIALRAVCSAGLFGQPNQTCAQCPIGASCPGYLSKEDSDFTAGTVYWGSTTYDGYGFHRPAVPQANFFNLNGTMAIACPKNAPGRFEERDVCIVACSPKDACIGSNLCKLEYRSIAPQYRCAACNIGYFRRGPECIPCPRNPALLIVGVFLGICAVAGLGYYLQRAKINIAIASIAIDYFQVLAIFSNAKIAWPPEIRELLYIFSAFNLNIEIVAPECLMPDVSFKQKWFAIMAIPIGVYFILLGIQGANIIYRTLGKGQRWKQATADAGQVAMSSLLTLFYLLYIYLSKNVFDVFSCVPVEPDDGQRYMTAGSAGLEPCGVEGGTQLTLLPWAIAALILYVIGYPAGLVYLFITRRELIMEDQLLRCRDQGDDTLTNPHALKTRQTFSRAYYAFKPDVYWWTLSILAKKLFITVTFVVFAQNPHFQLAACLLICFLAYAAQVRLQPYMPPSAYEDVYNSHRLMSLVTGSVHARLAARIDEIDAKAKRAARSNALVVSSNQRLNFVANWLFEYNTVDSVLLFCAIMVNLMALMYAALESSVFATGTKGVTVILILVIGFSLIYLTLALIGDIRLQCKARARRLQERTAEARAVARTKSKNKGGQLTAADVKKAAYESAAGRQRRGTQLQANPMFADNPRGGARDEDAEENAKMAARRGILAQFDAPDEASWRVFKGQFAELIGEQETVARDLNAQRIALRRVMETLNVQSSEELMSSLVKLSAISGRRKPAADGGPAGSPRTRTGFRPMLSADDDDAVMDSLSSSPAGAGGAMYSSPMTAGASPAAATSARAARGSLAMGAGAAGAAASGATSAGLKGYASAGGMARMRAPRRSRTTMGPGGSGSGGAADFAAAAAAASASSPGYYGDEPGDVELTATATGAGAGGSESPSERLTRPASRRRSVSARSTGTPRSRSGSEF